MSFPLTTVSQLVSDWSTGYQLSIMITNSTSTPTTSWNVFFSLPAGQSLSSSWNCTMTNSGSNYTAANPTWWGGGVIAAGASFFIGMVVQNSSVGPAGVLNLSAVANGNVPPPPVVPAVPVLASIASGSASYTVSWGPVTNATSYTLQQSASSSFASVTTFTIAQTSYSFSNQANGTYYYRVAATDSVGSSAYSNVQSVVVNVSPSAPVLNAVSNSGSGTYTVTWSSVSGASGYTLKNGTAIVYQGTNTSYNVSNQAVGFYTYTVIASSGFLMSVPSNAVSVTVSQTPPPPPASKAFVEGYWESWASDSVASIVAMNVNNINISFGTFTALGNNTFSVTGIDCDTPTLTSIVSLAHAAGKKIKLAIGGATYGLGGFLTSTAAAQGMANAVASFVKQYGLDGIDYDIEDAPASNFQIALIQYTRAALGANALLSYTPMTPTSTTAPYNQVVVGAHSYLSYINMMCYDAYAGYSYASDVSALIAMGVPANKLVVGLMPGKDDEGIMTSLTAVTAAANYVLNKGLAGVMYWDMNRDLNNVTGIGASATANALYAVLK